MFTKERRESLSQPRKVWRQDLHRFETPADLEVVHSVPQKQRRMSSYDEFCTIVRDVEGAQSEAQLRERFSSLDANRKGEVDMTEYILNALRQRLKREGARIMDVFRQWDENGSGWIDNMELRRAVLALNIEFVNDAEVDMLFDHLDADRDGYISFKELHRELRQRHSIVLDDTLRIGSRGQISTEKQQPHKLRNADSRSPSPASRSMR